VNLQRKAYWELLEWKDKNNRKPLIIRGARQVGKSTLVEDFSIEFDHYISLNLENPEDARLFNDIESHKDIVNALLLRLDTFKSGQSILIFLDEIQESPKAIQQLRYIYEQYPHLHVIAAGSLLEFTMRKVSSFPVGRVEQMVLHPFDFEEFLMAMGKKNVLNEIKQIPIKNFAHDTILKLFHQYVIIGGMPEIVKTYIEEESLVNLKDIYDSLWQGYRDDVEKYAGNDTERKIIRHIIDTASSEKDRISFAGFGNSNYRSREVGEAIRTLDLSRIIQLIYPTTNLQPPIIPDIKRKPRLQFLDSGLLNYSLGIQAELIGVKDLNTFYKGKIIQHVAAQQLQAQNKSPLYKPLFWVKEKLSSNAEVDLVIQHEQYIIPIEIKSGDKGRLRSLHQFVENSNHPYAVRLLANKFSIEEVKTPAGVNYLLMNMPYYLAHKLPQYVSWFIKSHPTD